MIRVLKAPVLANRDSNSFALDLSHTSHAPFQKSARGAPRFGRKLHVGMYPAPCRGVASRTTSIRLRITPTCLNIVFVAAEVAPWSKTGGLGDVVGGLPIELAKRGHKVMSIAPR